MLCAGIIFIDRLIIRIAELQLKSTLNKRSQNDCIWWRNWRPKCRLAVCENSAGKNDTIKLTIDFEFNIFCRHRSCKCRVPIWHCIIYNHMLRIWWCGNDIMLYVFVIYQKETWIGVRIPSHINISSQYIACAGRAKSACAPYDFFAVIICCRIYSGTVGMQPAIIHDLLHQSVRR